MIAARGPTIKRVLVSGVFFLYTDEKYFNFTTRADSFLALTPLRRRSDTHQTYNQHHTAGNDPVAISRVTVTSSYNLHALVLQYTQLDLYGGYTYIIRIHFL
jgi:hypothetical protein